MKQTQPKDWRITAFGLSLGMHVAAFQLLPYLERAPKQPPLRIEIDLALSQHQPEQAAPAAPPQPEVPKPEPRPAAPPKAALQPHQQALPLLTARADTPTSPQDQVVPDIPAPAAYPESVIPSAPATASAKVEESTTTTGGIGTRNLHSDEADPDEAWQGYGQMLYDMVSRNKTYPQMAIRRNWEGRAKVSARFSMGRLVELALLEPGSGHQVLDEAALEMLRKAVSALPIKGELARKSFTVIVPVDFRIEG